MLPAFSRIRALCFLTGLEIIARAGLVADADHGPVGQLKYERGPADGQHVDGVLDRVNRLQLPLNRLLVHRFLDGVERSRERMIAPWRAGHYDGNRGDQHQTEQRCTHGVKSRRWWFAPPVAVVAACCQASSHK